MFQRNKMRRFRRRPNGRNHMSRHPQPGMRSNQFANGQSRNNFRASMSVEKSFEKYSSLAKEAMSAGDKTLSENYLQHADHFMRMIEDKNRNRNLAKDNTLNKSSEENKSISQVKNTNDKEEIKNKD